MEGTSILPKIQKHNLIINCKITLMLNKEWPWKHWIFTNMSCRISSFLKIFRKLSSIQTISKTMIWQSWVNCWNQMRRSKKCFLNHQSHCVRTWKSIGRKYNSKRLTHNLKSFYKHNNPNHILTIKCKSSSNWKTTNQKLISTKCSNSNSHKNNSQIQNWRVNYNSITTTSKRNFIVLATMLKKVNLTKISAWIYHKFWMITIRILTKLGMLTYQFSNAFNNWSLKYKRIKKMKILYFKIHFTAQTKRWRGFKSKFLTIMKKCSRIYWEKRNSIRSYFQEAIDEILIVV